MKLFVLSKENLALARAEAERLHGVRGRLEGDLLFLDVAELRSGLAFTREVHEVMGAVKFARLSDIETLDYGFIIPPFAVRKVGDSPLPEKELAGFVWRGLEKAGKEPSVDLKNPRTEVFFFFLENEALLTSRSWRNAERFADRRSHLRPRNHPTGLSPKLARAMVNLAGPAETVLDPCSLPFSGSRTILDPFCGAGGILLEGALAGRQMTGADLDPEQVKRAEENLAGYGVSAALTVADARRCDSSGSFDAIVTDLPYGKNSKLDDAEGTFREFFAAAARCTDTMVVSLEEEMEYERFLVAWTPVASFSWYLHKSLSKRILVLEKA